MSSSSSFAISGDEQEQERINLEKNLLALDSHAQPNFYEDDHDYNEYTSIEQPRRRPGDSSREISLSRIRSIRSRATEDDLGLGQDSEIRAWSYRSDFSVDEDEDAVEPYATQAPRRSPRHHSMRRDSPSGYTAATTSSAQHHASALTMNAGLGGRETAKRRRGGENRAENTATTASISMSGAEYDPDRPIYDMLARVGQDWEKGMKTYDPLVVDDSGDIDALLASKAHSDPKRSVRAPSPMQSSSSLSSVASQPVHGSPSVRPKGQLSASAGPRLPSASVSQPPPTRASKTRQQYHPTPYDHNIPTPKQHRVSFSVPAPSNARSHPPAQKIAGKRSTPPGITRTHIEASPEAVKTQLSGRRRDDSHSIYASPAPNKLKPNSSYSLRYPSPSPARVRLNHEFASPGVGRSVQLPDFTGITTAIESPAPVRIVLNATGSTKKNHLGVGYKQYHHPPSHSHKENAILSTLNTLRKRLMVLEEENSATRQRVCALEGELKRVKTRTMNRDESIDDRQERHALQSLIRSLHDHLDRLTRETTEQGKILGILLKLIKPLSGSSEQISLNERIGEFLRDQAEKTTIVDEVGKLRTHVERLTGEVEALREVVEEGLRSRDDSEVETSEIESVGGDTDTEDALEDDEIVQDRRETASARGEIRGNLSHQDHGALNEDDTRSSLPSKQAHARIKMTLRSPDASVSRSLTEEFERCKVKEPMPPFGLASTSRHPMRTSTPPPTSAGAPRPLPINPAAESIANVPTSIVESPSNRPDDPSFAETADRRQDHPAPNPAQVATIPSAIRTLPPSRPGYHDDQELHNRLNAPDTETEVSLDSRFLPKRPLTADPTTVNDDCCRTIDEQQPAEQELVPEPKLHSAKLDKMLREAPDHDTERCTACRRTNTARELHSRRIYRDTVTARKRETNDCEHGQSERALVQRLLQELQDDFSHYKSIYMDISSQYEQLDAISNVPQRNALARHLHDIIDILEHKGDQIAALTDMVNGTGAYGNTVKARVVSIGSEIVG